MFCFFGVRVFEVRVLGSLCLGLGFGVSLQLGFNQRWPESHFHTPTPFLFENFCIQVPV